MPPQYAPNSTIPKSAAPRWPWQGIPLDTDIPVVQKLVLRHTDKLSWIKKEHTTIVVFLPLLRIGTAETLGPQAA